ncbi:hypothetical protein BDZ89DRAFT_1056625 [Hymenopellis radicata]|nr:hypothetical protein BDZ89DRAFT_1056625 [Hymenopellis radicata]
MDDIYKPYNISRMESPLSLTEQKGRVSIMDCPSRHTGSARAHLEVQSTRSGTPCQERAALERIAKAFAQRADEHYDYDH